MRVDSDTGLPVRKPTIVSQVDEALRAIREAEQEAYEASLRSGAYGVLTHTDGENCTVGVHTGVPFGRAITSSRKPRGLFLTTTVRKFRLRFDNN